MSRKTKRVHGFLNHPNFRLVFEYHSYKIYRYFRLFFFFCICLWAYWLQNMSSLRTIKNMHYTTWSITKKVITFIVVLKHNNNVYSVSQPYQFSILDSLANFNKYKYCLSIPCPKRTCPLSETDKLHDEKITSHMSVLPSIRALVWIRSHIS